MTVDSNNKMPDETQDQKTGFDGLKSSEDNSSKETRTELMFNEELPQAVKDLDLQGEKVAQKSQTLLEKFSRWRRANMSDQIFLLWLAVVVGLFAGFGAHIFNRLITIVSEIFLSRINPDGINWWLIFPPVIGIVLSGIYTRYIVRTNLTHVVTRLSRSLYKGNFKLKPNIIYSPIIGGTITLGLGGSAGSEGPIAYSGAAIGSNLAQWLGLRQELMKVLVGCGAAAGISGIFMSPVGGLLFALEFLKMEMGTFSILAVMISCLVAYGIGFICNGCIPSLAFTPELAVEPSQYWSILLLGVFCGLYSLYYTRIINLTDSIFTRIKNPWIMNVAGGLVIGASLLLFPGLFGVGYPVMSDVIHSQFNEMTEGNVFNSVIKGDWGLIIVAACILILKCWACGACNASGGVSSDFAPTLYAGAIAGFLFSMFCNTALHTHLPVGAFTLLGMGAVMAACVEAPLMTIFIVLNMGMDMNFMLGLIISVFTSYTTIRVCSHIRGYDSSMMSHLKYFHTHHDQDTRRVTSLKISESDPPSK